jgi:hypothetical protein
VVDAAAASGEAQHTRQRSLSASRRKEAALVCELGKEQRRRSLMDRILTEQVRSGEQGRQGV